MHPPPAPCLLGGSSAGASRRRGRPWRAFRRRPQQNKSDGAPRISPPPRSLIRPGMLRRMCSGWARMARCATSTSRSRQSSSAQHVSARSAARQFLASQPRTPDGQGALPARGGLRSAAPASGGGKSGRIRLRISCGRGCEAACMLNRRAARWGSDSACFFRPGTRPATCCVVSLAARRCC